MYRIGAIFYLAWGIIHLLAAYRVGRMGSGTSKGVVQGRLLQSAWNLMLLAIAVSVVAVLLNWQNDPLGYWLNLTLVTSTDIGFIIFILAPGYVPWWPGSIGPVLWLLAAVFSTLGMLGIAA
jgi:hypothetical protein